MNEQPTSVCSNWKSFTGIGVILGFGCALMFSFGSVFVKLLNSNSDLHALYLAAVRQTFILFFAAPQVAYHRASYIGERPDWLFLLLRAACGCVGICCSFASYSYLPLADAGVIQATTPAFTTLLGRIFLKEKLHFSDGPVLLLTISGIAFILRPVFVFKYIFPSSTIADEITATDRLIGSAFALAGAIVQSGNYVTIRHLRRANYATVSFTYGLLTTPILWVVVASFGLFKMPPSYVDRTMAIGVGATAMAAQALMMMAAKIIPAGVVSMMGSTETLFNFVWQVVLIHGSVHPFSIIGCLLVIVAISFLSLRTIIVQKYKQDKPNTDGNRGNCFIQFLLKYIFR